MQQRLIVPFFGGIYSKLAPITEPLIRVVAVPIIGFLVTAIVT